jgi:hypothetical protein
VQTIQNSNVTVPVLGAVANAYVPNVFVPLSTQITAVIASSFAEAFAPLFSHNTLSIWKSENPPVNTVWKTPTITVIPFQ